MSEDNKKEMNIGILNDGDSYYTLDQTENMSCGAPKLTKCCKRFLTMQKCNVLHHLHDLKKRV